MSGRYSTAEEVQQDHMAKFGPVLGPVFHALHNEVAWTHAKWQEFRTLFATSPERIALLNRAAGGFFRIIQDSLVEDVILSISRLTDPAHSLHKKGKDNLTLVCLPNVIDEAHGISHPDAPKNAPPAPKQRSELGSRVEALVTTALDVSRFSRDWRNRHLAHRDLALALGQGAQALEPVTRADIQASLVAFAKVMNEVYGHYFPDSSTSYEMILSHDDAGSLVYHLEVAIKAEDEERAELLGYKHNRPVE